MTGLELCLKINQTVGESSYVILWRIKMLQKYICMLCQDFRLSRVICDKKVKYLCELKYHGSISQVRCFDGFVWSAKKKGRPNNNIVEKTAYVQIKCTVEMK